MGRMALTHAVRILYMTMLLSICVHCVNASTIWHTILLSRNYVMQLRDDKQGNRNQTVHTQLQFINIQHLSQGCLCCRISCRCHILREAAAGLA